jgi:hypothetical protein
MGKRNEEFVLILDIDRVFSAKELEAVQAAETEIATEDEISEQPSEG